MTGALVLAAAAELCLIDLNGVTVCVAAAALGFAGQTVKLTGDVAMQSDVVDTYRGQVFAVQDALFNGAFVAATVLAALVLPLDGVSAGIVVFAVAVCLVGAYLIWRRYPKAPRPPETPVDVSLSATG